MLDKSNREKWATHRSEAHNRVVTDTVRKTANLASDNAVIAARIKAKLLKHLEREIDALPENIGSETRKTVIDNQYAKGDKKGLLAYGQVIHSEEISRAYKLRDLTAAYKDLTADMPKENSAEQVRIIIDV